MKKHLPFQTLALLYLLPLLGAVSCTRYFRVHDSKSQTVAVTDSLQSTALSTKVANYLSPLHDTLAARMNGILVKSEKRLVKGQPESELGNLLADIILEKTKEHTGKNIDVAVTNSGGIRAELPAGGITLGNVYEIMPFENEIVVLTLSGQTMKKFIDYIGQRKDPQAGMQLVIDKSSNQVIEVKINGLPLDENKTYTVATSDYVANGGDKAEFLKERLGYDKIGLLLRDAFVDYFKQKGRKGETINPKKDGRTQVR